MQSIQTKTNLLLMTADPTSLDTAVSKKQKINLNQRRHQRMWGKVRNTTENPIQKQDLGRVNPEGNRYLVI